MREQIEDEVKVECSSKLVIFFFVLVSSQGHIGKSPQLCCLWEILSLGKWHLNLIIVQYSDNLNAIN